MDTEWNSRVGLSEGWGERVSSMQSRGLPGGAAMYSSQPRAAQRSLTDTDPAPRNPPHGHTRREIIRKNGISDSVRYIFTIWGVDWTLDRNVLHDEEIPFGELLHVWFTGIALLSKCQHGTIGLSIFKSYCIKSFYDSPSISHFSWTRWANINSSAFNKIRGSWVSLGLSLFGKMRHTTLYIKC